MAYTKAPLSSKPLLNTFTGADGIRLVYPRRRWPGLVLALDHESVQELKDHAATEVLMKDIFGESRSE